MLGTAFLLFLLLINLLHSCGREEPGAPETEEALPQHIPVVRELKNVWIMEAEAGQITLFCDGVRETYDLDTEANEAGCRQRTRCGNSWQMWNLRMTS